MRINGKVSHGPEPLAGHKKATKGKAGCLMPDMGSVVAVLLLKPPGAASSCPRLFRGLCEAILAGEAQKGIRNEEVQQNERSEEIIITASSQRAWAD